MKITRSEKQNSLLLNEKLFNVILEADCNSIIEVYEK